MSGRISAIVLGVSLAAGLLTTMPAREAQAGDGCKLVAEIGVETIRKGSLSACTRSGNPVVCAIALAAELAEDKAKRGVEAGCRWIVKKVGDKVRIEVTGEPAKAPEIREVYKEINVKVRDLKWIEKILP
jgi:hypothetical protein